MGIKPQPSKLSQSTMPGYSNPMNFQQPINQSTVKKKNEQQKKSGQTTTHNRGKK